MRYGKKNHMNLGTTLTVILFVGARYSFVHVGDSRIYEITYAGKVKQLTEDQTFVHREILAGRMTEEEAANHPKRNVLLQCIGSSKKVEPEVGHGNVKKGSSYLLCSDGFRHCLSSDQIASLGKVAKGKNYEKNLEAKLKDLAAYDMKNGESDNITAAVINVVGV